MDPDNLLELLNSGLKNDSTPESFLLKHKLHGQPIPSKLVKIVPLEPWAASYNFSIWHIGKTAEDVLEQTLLRIDLADHLTARLQAVDLPTLLLS